MSTLMIGKRLIGRDTLAVAALLAPALFALGLFLLIPGGFLVAQSFTETRLGVGAAWSFTNYTELLRWAYFGFFLDTLRLSFISTVLGLLIAFPVAYTIARTPSQIKRVSWISFLFAMLFVSVLVRVYSLALSFGPAGFLRHAIVALNINPNGRGITEMQVVAGLMQYVIPMSALTLIGTIQNVDPKLHDSALSLGARPWRSHLDITLPLSREGILSSFLLSYTFCISSFVIPLILGQGRVQFVANLVYSRFSEIADYGSGAAVSVVLAVISFLIVLAVSWLGHSRWSR